MTSILLAFDQYLAMWNEPDLTALRPHIEMSCAPGIIFADPNEYTVGHDELEAMAVRVKESIPGAVYRRCSGVDVQHRRYRYLWEIILGGERIVHGMDVATVDDNGRIERIDGFFTPLPPPA